MSFFENTYKSELIQNYINNLMTEWLRLKHEVFQIDKEMKIKKEILKKIEEALRELKVDLGEEIEHDKDC